MNEYEQVYVAMFIWPEAREPVCAGFSKKRTIAKAYTIMRKRHGTGPVERPRALCSSPITYADFEVDLIPMIWAKDKHG